MAPAVDQQPKVSMDVRHPWCISGIDTSSDRCYITL